MNIIIKTTFTACALYTSSVLAQPTHQAGWLLETAGPAVLSPQNSSIEIDMYTWFDPTAGWAFAAAGAEVYYPDLTLWNIEFSCPPSTVCEPEYTIHANSINVLHGQIHFPPVIPGSPENPFYFATLTLTTSDFTPRTIDMTTTTSVFKLYESEFTATSVEIPLANLSEGFLQIEVIPAPTTSLALLAAAGALGMRRRR